MKSEHIILMSTHILQLARDVSDDIVLLRDGQLSYLDAADMQTSNSKPPLSRR